jgi:hypothetical protein
MNKLKLIASISLLAISANSAFAQTKSSLPASWQTNAKHQVKEEKPVTTSSSSTNTDKITSPQQLPKGAILLPAAFLSSCAAKKQGNACEFNMDANRKVKGMCESITPNGPLGCKASNPEALLPESAKPKLSDANKKTSTPNRDEKNNTNPPADYPPFKACEGKTIGKACAMNIEGKKIDGICFPSSNINTKKTTCVPNNKSK